MSATSKEWTVSIVSPPAGALAVLRDGHPLPAEIGPGLTTPVEILLVSIGTCFALSCWAAFAARKLERVRFEVRVTGRKAAQLPSRLAHIDLQVTFDDSLASAEAQAITASAEKLCTVTNTLVSEPRSMVSVELM